MSVAAVLSSARRRPLRSVVWLMVALWLLQVGAQFCAVQCGLAGGLERAAPLAGPSEPAPMLASIGDEAVVAASAGSADCPVGAWCDVGQSSMLPASAPIAADRFLQPMAAGPPASRPSFLRIPDDRPPAA